MKAKREKPKSKIKLEEWITAQTSYARREVARFIMDGRVRVNGNPNLDLSAMVDPEQDVVHLDDERLMHDGRYYYFKFHKPVDVISTMSDPNGRICLLNYMSGIPESVAPVGRLDRDSEGLMLFTNDGQLSLALSHPRYHVSKVYRVTLDKPLTQAHFDRLTVGFFLDDGPVVFETVEKVSDISVVVKISEGRNRIIRRSFDMLGYTVKKLKRLSMGPINLGNLEAGKFAKLTTGEMRQLDQILKFR